jgi:hypothetical protein
MATQPGWHADPSDPAQLRWWDGTAWTEHVSRPAALAPAWPVPTSTAPASSRKTLVIALALVAAVVVIMGVLAVIAGMNGFRQARTQAQAISSARPRANIDHWHTAYGVFLCDHWLPPVGIQKDPFGIHSHGDGVIHVHPFSIRSSGSRARLGAWTDVIDAEVTPTRLRWPLGASAVDARDGDTALCGTPGRLHYLVNGLETTGDPNRIRLTDRGRITIAYLGTPAGVDLSTLASPPSTPMLDVLSDVRPSAPTTSIP